MEEKLESFHCVRMHETEATLCRAQRPCQFHCEDVANRHREGPNLLAEAGAQREQHCLRPVLICGQTAAPNRLTPCRQRRRQWWWLTCFQQLPPLFTTLALHFLVWIHLGLFDIKQEW